MTGNHIYAVKNLIAKYRSITEEYVAELKKEYEFENIFSIIRTDNMEGTCMLCTTSEHSCERCVYWSNTPTFEDIENTPENELPFILGCVRAFQKEGCSFENIIKSDSIKYFVETVHKRADALELLLKERIEIERNNILY